MKILSDCGGKLLGILFVGFFLVLFLTIGVGLIYLGIRDIVHTKASLNWPHTNGKVVSSSIKKTASSGSKSSISYQADIEYEYLVNNQTYKNYRVSYGDYGAGESLAQEVVSRYSMGKPVTVYYEPDDPSESVLEPEGTKKGTFLKIIAGFIFLSFGVFIAVVPYLARKIRKNIENDEPTSNRFS